MTGMVQFLLFATAFFYAMATFSYCVEIRLIPFAVPFSLTGLLVWAIILREINNGMSKG